MKTKDNKEVRDVLLEYGSEKLRRYHRLLQDAHIYEDFLKFGEYLVSNPFLLLLCFAVILVLLLPFFLFIIFAVVNAVFAFIGFVLIQVTVLAIGASILTCILFCMVTTAGVFGVSIFLLYCTGRYVKQCIKILISR